MTQKEDYTKWYQYILDCVNSDDVDVTTMTDKEKIEFILERFNEERNGAWWKQEYPLLSDRIANFLQGLPSSCSVAFSDYDVLQIGKSWGLAYNPAHFVHYWFKNCGRRIVELANKYEIDLHRYY